MKKLLLFIAIIGLSFSSYSQDITTINELVNATSLDQVKNTSDKIAAAAAEKFEYFKTADRTVTLDKYKVIVYTPQDFAPENKNKLTPEEKEQCLLYTNYHYSIDCNLFKNNLKQQYHEKKDNFHYFRTSRFWIYRQPTNR